MIESFTARIVSVHSTDEYVVIGLGQESSDGYLMFQRSLPVGSEIVVTGYQSKDRSCRPACKANGRDMTFADGRKLFMGSSGTGAPRDGSDPNER